MKDFSASFAAWMRPKSRTCNLSQFRHHFARLTLSLLVLFLTAVLTAPVHAEVSLRIAEPITDPVKIRAEVTDDNGDPVTNLSKDDFKVAVDDNEITSGITFSQPARDDTSQRVSVIFVMDYSTSIVPAFEAPMVEATQSFIEAMEVGDFAGILKFRGGGSSSLIAALQEITGDAVRNELKDKAAEVPALSGKTALLDGIEGALEAFEAKLDTLPPGPKTIILVSDGIDNDSQSNREQLRDLAKTLGVAIFSVGVGDVTGLVPDRDPPQTGEDILQSLADITGGTYQFSPDDAGIRQIYADISDSLLNEYLLTFDYGIAACQEYTIQVALDEYGEATKAVKSSQASCGGSSSGGGGAIGPLGLIAGLSLLAFRRRRMPA